MTLATPVRDLGERPVRWRFAHRQQKHQQRGPCRECHHQQQSNDRRAADDGSDATNEPLQCFLPGEACRLSKDKSLGASARQQHSRKSYPRVSPLIEVPPENATSDGQPLAEFAPKAHVSPKIPGLREPVSTRTWRTALRCIVRKGISAPSADPFSPRPACTHAGEGSEPGRLQAGPCWLRRFNRTHLTPEGDSRLDVFLAGKAERRAQRARSCCTFGGRGGIRTHVNLKG